MINLMTLNAALPGAQSKKFPWPVTLFRQNEIDLLCCQSVPCTPDDQTPDNRRLPAFSGLTCSCFAPGRPRRPDTSDDEQLSGGLAIFTGAGVWVLNSGSFIIGEGEVATLVQFALVRKHGASLLALNLQLDRLHETRIRQLCELFAHDLLNASYGAVVLCANRAATFSAMQWKQISARSGYVLRQKPLATSSIGLLGLFTSRRPKTPATRGYWSARAEAVNAGHASSPSVLTMAVDIQRIDPDTPSRPAFPLSFYEQWPGCREQRILA